MLEEKFFTEKYRPRVIDDCILPERVDKVLRGMIDGGDIENILLYGSAGIGKTTMAKVLCNTLDFDYMLINCSENGNIDTLRTKIRDFASSVSITSSVKCVILDESDGLTATTQQALRGFMDEFTKNCRFIFTANYPNKIIEALKSRTTSIDFTLRNDTEIKDVKRRWFLRLIDVLGKEGIEFDKKVLGELINKHFPDFRKTLNELQSFTKNRELVDSDFTVITRDEAEHIFGLLRDKKFTQIRQLVAENPQYDMETLIRTLWNKVDEFVQADKIPEFLMITNNYQEKDGRVIDKSINVVAYLTELMVAVKFK